jgi:vacuolar-type H+-ATPase subunit H
MTTPLDIDETDAAINRVLEAERFAREEIRSARGQALTLLREARAHSRRVRQGLDRHIRRVHRLCDVALERERAALARQAAAVAEPPILTEVLTQRLDAALERLLDEISGAPP